MTDARKIPMFTSREEEAAFWDSHDITDFLDELEPVKTNAAKNLSSAITVRFPADALTVLRTIADEQGVGPTTLIRMWVLERLRWTNRGSVAEVKHGATSSLMLDNTKEAPTFELAVGTTHIPFTVSTVRSRK